MNYKLNSNLNLLKMKKLEFLFKIYNLKLTDNYVKLAVFDF
jgi:hypothetical protein